MEPSLDLDPKSLQECEDVDVQTESRTVARSAFATARDVESHVTIGVANDAGDVLVVGDGARGWTLPAVPVAPDADWADEARRAVASLTGSDATIAEPIRLRRVEFRQEGDPDRSVTSFDVLVRAAVDGRPVANEPTLAGEDVEELLWVEDAPEPAPEGVAADVRAVRDRSGSE